MSIRVMIADDQEVVRTGLHVLVARDPGLDVVGEAATGDHAVRLVRELRPDVVLMDIRMPGLDGIQATREILGNPDTTSTKVIMLTTFDTDEHLFDALRAGASGFLLKDTSPAELRQAVHAAANGDALLAPSVTKRLIAQYVQQPTEPEVTPAALAGLTEREMEIVGLVGRGLSNERIAGHLHLSPATVKTHVGRAMTKLDAHDRAQLVIAAYEAGLVRPGSRGGLPADGPDGRQ